MNNRLFPHSSELRHGSDHPTPFPLRTHQSSKGVAFHLTSDPSFKTTARTDRCEHVTFELLSFRSLARVLQLGVCVQTKSYLSQEWPQSDTNETHLGHLVVELRLIFSPKNPPSQSDPQSMTRGLRPEVSSGLYILRGKRADGSVIGDVVPLFPRQYHPPLS